MQLQKEFFKCIVGNQPDDAMTLLAGVECDFGAIYCVWQRQLACIYTHTHACVCVCVCVYLCIYLCACIVYCLCRRTMTWPMRRISTKTMRWCTPSTIKMRFVFVLIQIGESGWFSSSRALFGQPPRKCCLPAATGQRALTIWRTSQQPQQRKGVGSSMPQLAQ